MPAVVGEWAARKFSTQNDHFNITEPFQSVSRARSSKLSEAASCSFEGESLGPMRQDANTHLLQNLALGSSPFSQNTRLWNSMCGGNALWWRQTIFLKETCFVLTERKSFKAAAIAKKNYIEKQKQFQATYKWTHSLSSCLDCFLQSTLLGYILAEKALMLSDVHNFARKLCMFS